ncbi:antitoxin ParD1/3/4 [Nitrosospira multiformis]|uniref:Antitoxin ParD1/3/4 n=1 Tax=Nitrosospira multiformis TaxID=1231 RepID=A0A2T5IH45_9PROT|nr:type II toxin-antitoxin system ParD family antitoxin [Nitrosospira multiformis]PTQ83154.1 antitoxin ParD1/3/4 [Nitrosospira multiformis]
MHIELADVDEKYIKDSVRKGYYRSEAEAVRDAVRKMREQDEAKRMKLLDALQLGMDDIEAGQVTPYTPDFLDQCETRARQNIAAGRKPSPDVTP